MVSGENRKLERPTSRCESVSEAPDAWQPPGARGQAEGTCGVGVEFPGSPSGHLKTFVLRHAVLSLGIPAAHRMVQSITLASAQSPEVCLQGRH